MLIRLVVVSTALSGAMLLLLAMAHRLRAAKDQIRLNHGQAQTRLHAAQEQARLAGVLLMLRELVPRLSTWTQVVSARPLVQLGTANLPLRSTGTIRASRQCSP